MEAWLDQVHEPSGLTNRQRVWAQVKDDVEWQLKTRKTLRMPDNLRDAHQRRITGGAHVPDTLELVVLWITQELDDAGVTFASGKPQDLSLGSIMHSRAFIEHHMGGRSDFSRLDRKLAMQLAPALLKSGLWKRHRPEVNGKRVTRYYRTDEALGYVPAKPAVERTATSGRRSAWDSLGADGPEDTSIV